MTDNELNALVAERVMGIRIDPPYCNCVRCQKGINVRANEIPDYANDIAAAWQVVGRVGTGWIIYNNRGTFEIYDSIYNLDEGRAIESDTSPSRAVCLAALKAVGVEI